jgi:DNA invertase Pin-like site-specific DNA recombinase
VKSFAFYGRVSSDDAQDPSLSIPRQLSACERAVAAVGGEIVCWYWDVESGRKALEDRGKGNSAWREKVSVPCAGGLPELLAAAYDRWSLNAVIVESIDRLSRMTADATRIERALEQRDIGLFAADEPMSSDATSILTRRIKQGVAEWYVRDLIEKSRRGMEESVRQGWHTGGRAPYGYALEEHQHPNPSKAREGKRKHRLILDPTRAPVVLMIFEDYCLRRLGLGEITDKLNGDLDHYPPPATNPKDEMALKKTWSRSQIQAMLRNPKYTGYNVWGRHDKRPGRPLIRPHDEWVWSPAPTHPAIVPKELFDRVGERARRNTVAATQAPADYPTRRTRRAGRVYSLRGRVRCSLCGRRMEGTHQKGSNYYRCRFTAGRGNSAADAVGHPRALQIKEDTVLEVVLGFMDRRLFGPARLDHLRQELANSANANPDEHRHSADLLRLQAELKDIDQSLYRQALRMEEHEDPDHPVIALAKQRIAELSARRETVRDAIRTTEAQQTEVTQPHEIEAMLERIPDLRPTLKRADPEELSEILATFDITATYSKHERFLDLAATLDPELIASLNKNRPPQGRSGKSSIAGAGLKHLPPTLLAGARRIKERWYLQAESSSGSPIS